MNDKYKEWWNSLSDIKKHNHFRKQANELYKAYNQFLLALKKSADYGNNRVGIRGGRFTTLMAKTENKSKLYYDLLEELNYIIKQL